MKDDVIEEVRRAREAIAAKFNFDIKAMIEDARKRQKDSGRRVVSFEKPKKK
jgi:hypothetical protein